MEAARKSRKLKTRRRKHLLKNYFKYPIGMTSGTTHYDFSAQESLCACLIAYCYSFLLPEGSWTPNFINEMLLSVAEHDQEVDVDPAGELSPLSRTLLIEKYSLDVFLQEISSGGMNQERDTLFEDLQRSFKSRKCLLIIAGEECVIIWTKDDHYGFFTFVPNKRNILLVATLKDLVTSLRFLYASDTSYRICEVKITRLQQRCEGEEIPQLPGRGFVLVDDDLAILRGNLQIKPSPGEIRGLFTGYAAAIFAYRIPLNSWDSDTLDRVLLLSETLSRKSLMENGRKTSYIVSCGAFRSHLDVEIVFYSEFLEVLEDIRRIENFLTLGNCLVVEYQGFHWTVMQQNLFYLLNPYESLGSASTLQMHGSFQGVLAVLANFAEEATQVTLHIIRTVSVEEGEPNSPAEEPMSSKSAELKELERMEREKEMKLQEEENRKKQEQERQMEEMVRNLKLKRKQIQSKLEEIEVLEQIQEVEEVQVEEPMFLEGEDLKQREQEMQMEGLLRSLKETHESSGDIFSSSEESLFDEAPQNSPNFHLSGLEQSEAGTETFPEETETLTSVTELSPGRSKTPSSEETPTGGTYEIRKEEIPTSRETSGIRKEAVKENSIASGIKKEPVKEVITSRSSSPETLRDDLIVLQSVTGAPRSLNKLLRKGLTLSNRFLITTPQKRFLVLHRNRWLFLYRGCVCKISHLPREITNQEKFQPFRTISSLIDHLLDINGGKFM